jgi:hypothetical protein
MALLDFLFGRTKPVPTTTQVQTRTEIPAEIAPFAKEVLEEAQQIYGERRDQGFQEFPGETIAPRTPEELAAMEGLRGLVGTQEPYRAEQEARIRSTPTAFTSQQAETFMNPYQQSVIDVAKRKAQEDFEQRIMPQFEKQAVDAGGMSGLGTRAAVQASELGKGLQERLSDIQIIGQQKAFEDAYKKFGDQINRERVKAGDISSLGQQRFNIGLAERGLQQQLAQEDRAEAQAILADQFAEFTEREQFPEQTLAQYSSFVYGNPFLRQADTIGTTTGTLQPTTSSAQQLLGLGLTGLQTIGRGTQGSFNLSDFSLGNIFRKKGGPVGGGLDSLPVVYRQQNARVGAGLNMRGARNLRQSRANVKEQNKINILNNLMRQAQEEEKAKSARITGELLKRAALGQAQIDARNQLTLDSLGKLSVGTDQKIGPDFSRATKAVLDEKPTQGLIGLLARAGSEAFEGQDIKVRERDKIKRDVAKIESTLRTADLAKEQAQATANLAATQQEAARAAAATSKIEKDKITKGMKAKKLATDELAANVKIEKDIIDMYDSDLAKGKATSDQNPATLKRQGLEEVLARFNYVIDKEGKLAFRKAGNVLKETDENRQKMLNARDRYNVAFSKYLNDVKKAKGKKGSLSYLDANDAALFAAKAAKAAQ